MNIIGDFERCLLVGNRASLCFTFLLKVKRKDNVFESQVSL